MNGRLFKKVAGALSLLLLPAILPGQEVLFHPPFYYKETPFGYELIEELPRDTVYIRDTLYISDIDAFLQTYVAHGENINGIAGDIRLIQETLSALDSLTDEKLYYNFFLRSDSLRRISDNYIVREFSLTEELTPETLQEHRPEIPDESLRREILFRIDGMDRTARFIHNKDAIRRTISYLFTQMQEDPHGIRGINLYFPDYTFRYKRAMTQFVKSVRIMMDASRDFKFGKTVLNVIFHSQKGYEDGVDRDFQYSLEQEASSVVFIDGVDVLEHFYVKGKRATSDELKSVGIFHKIRSHFFIARYYTGNLDITQFQLTEFSEQEIREVLEIDYKENNWEIFLFLTVALLVLLCTVGFIYRENASFSSFVNRHTESALLILIVLALEIGILLITVFQNMCKEDSFTILERHPGIIFLLPLVIVLIAPLLHRFIKNRKTP